MSKGIGEKYLFLSTPSARRATEAERRKGRGEGISIHALREEGDSAQSVLSGCIFYFYPRPPRGGRPENPERLWKIKKISIHALREEGDQQVR